MKLSRHCGCVAGSRITPRDQRSTVQYELRRCSARETVTGRLEGVEADKSASGNNALVVAVLLFSLLEGEGFSTLIRTVSLIGDQPHHALAVISQL